ncbi:hypothetical protein NFI96_031966 [Prochilodus magdalenae]|nr:hypothetical protein NFI96_031966 [Prochilodus magdalenae]
MRDGSSEGSCDREIIPGCETW